MHYLLQTSWSDRIKYAFQQKKKNANFITNAEIKPDAGVAQFSISPLAQMLSDHEQLIGNKHAQIFFSMIKNSN